MKIWQLTKGIAAFLIIWLICLAASPIFLVIIAGKYAADFLATRKVNKELAPQKTLWYIPATKDNNIHSAN